MSEVIICDSCKEVIDKDEYSLKMTHWTNFHSGGKSGNGVLDWDLCKKCFKSIMRMLKQN